MRLRSAKVGRLGEIEPSGRGRLETPAAGVCPQPQPSAAAQQLRARGPSRYRETPDCARPALVAARFCPGFLFRVPVPDVLHGNAGQAAYPAHGDWVARQLAASAVP